ncbi:MAG TPA: ATP-binding protein [Longimicrobium sp.]|nr:ATP-binding protein [Longimicrobium sp.]
MVKPDGAAPAAARRPRFTRHAWAWLGGWVAVLAMAAWMLRLSPGWLVAAGIGTLPWALFAPGRAARVAAGAALAAAVSIGGAVQFRLHRIAAHWSEVRYEAEERAGAELSDQLDEVFDQGGAAVAAAANATARAPRATVGLFRRLEVVRRQSGVTALAVYLPDGSPLVWAGEHRGTVPDSVRAGLLDSSFSAGPLFGYVYFSQRMPGGRVAVAALLLEAHVSVGEGPLPYADRFARRFGVTPRFTTPDRAQGQVWDWSAGDRKILSVAFATITQERWRDRVAARGRWAAGVALLIGALALAIEWYRRRAGPAGVPIAAITGALVILTAGGIAGAEGVFSPVSFVLPLPGDINLGQLLILLTGGGVWLLSRRRTPRVIAILPLAARVAAAAGGLVLALWLVRESAAPGVLATRAAGGPWLFTALAVLAALPLYALLGGPERARSRHLRAVLLVLAIAAAVALAAGLVAWWRPGREAPVWSAALWAIPFALAAAATTRGQVARGALLPWVMSALIGTSLALPQLWAMHLTARLQQAERELGRLGVQPDPFLDFLLRQFAEKVLFYSAEGREGVSLLYQAWVEGGLAREGYEARITLWDRETAAAELRLSDQAEIPPDRVDDILRSARAAEEPMVSRFTDSDQMHYLLVVPLPGGRTVTVAVPPRRHLGRSTALARFLDPAAQADGDDAAASLSLVPSAEARGEAPPPGEMRWLKAPAGWRSEEVVRFPSRPMHAHLLVPTPSTGIVLIRGILALGLVLAAATALWAIARTLCGEPLGLASGQWVWFWTFRGRLTLALFVFFLLPMAAFGETAYRALSREVERTAAAVADQSLAQAAAEANAATIEDLAQHIGADLLLYHRGVLVEAATPEVIDLGLYHSWLPPAIYLGFTVGEAVQEHEERRLAGHEYLVAYRALGEQDALASPTPLATGEIARRQRELADVILLAVLFGGVLSVVLSLLVGRALSRPIEAMSQASAAVGEGDLSVRLSGRRRDEFGGLYRSFNRMVRRLRLAQSALVRETRRTEAIVAQAGTGVMALDAQGRVALVNPRASQILGAELEPGDRIPEDRPLPATVAATVRSFLAEGTREWSDEREVDGRVVRLRLRRLPAEEGARGAVLVLEDVTAEIRSARVLAWGEMARQVAHEIKNPLTPIKLSVQHVRRAWSDGRENFGEILDRNVEAVLREIDRLGEIARAFSRFGTPQESAEPAEPLDVLRVAEDTLALYRGGDDGIAYLLEVEEGTPRALAREGELREVLVNLLENARGALDGGGGQVRIVAGPAGGGAWVRIDVEDTGEGIAPELLPRIFEPRFSTRTSGTGLGLAIVRRMVESWGAEITVDSAPGTGTTVHLRLRAAPVA